MSTKLIEGLPEGQSREGGIKDEVFPRDPDSKRA